MIDRKYDSLLSNSILLQNQLNESKESDESEEAASLGSISAADEEICTLLFKGSYKQKFDALN